MDSKTAYEEKANSLRGKKKVRNYIFTVMQKYCKSYFKKKYHLI
jgi:hypothetical protein